MPIKLTNKHNIPDVFVRACMIDRHVTKGDISTTQLIDAPQIRYLKAHHDIEEDVSDRLWMLMGTAMHHVLERAEVKNYYARQLMDAAIVLEDLDKVKGAESLRQIARDKFPDAFDSEILLEQTMSVLITTDLGTMEVSGTMDKFNKTTGTLFDYKNTSVYGYIYEESKKKWYAQQNIYAYMLRKHDYTVNEAFISAFFKDYKSFEAKQSRDYPPSMVMDIPIPLYDMEKMEKYMKGRVKKHQLAEAGENIPCTPKERWAEADMWAVKKKGGKRALKGGVLPSESMAKKFIEDNKLNYTDMYIEFRPGTNKRCDSYCPVRSVCPQKRANDLRKEENEQLKSN
jgi:PD-(D/E)XK nuclease superfamily